MTETLMNSANPLALFHRVFIEHVITPFVESHNRMHAEHVAKEKKIIAALDAERAHAWYAHDIKWRLLAAA
jgi:hypothetical protein